MIEVNETIRVALVGSYTSVFLTDSQDVFDEIGSKSSGINKVASSSTLIEIENSVPESKLDVLILTDNIGDNLSMTVKHARSKYNAAGILVINNYFDCELLASGADGLIVGSHSIDIAIQGIRSVCKRNFFFADCVCDYCVDAAIENIPRPPLRLRIKGLDARDMDIITLSAKGLTNSEIGDMLTTSPKTIEKLRTNIYRTTGCNDYRELTIFALKNDIIHLCDL